MKVSDRVPELDALRFVAALFVVFFHLLREGPFAEAARYGFLGVPLFFLISGFVILWTATGRTAWQFLVTRLARLYPTFWVCVLLTAITLSLIGNTPEASVLFGNLTMVPGRLGVPLLDKVYWTLYYEILFYALIFLVLLFRQIERIEWLLWAWLICPLVGWPKLLTFAGYAPFFIGGCWLYLIRARGLTVLRLGGLGVAAVLGTLAVVERHTAFTHLPGLVPTIIVATAVVGMHLLLLLISMRRLRLPASPSWFLLGTLTYPLYLVHTEIGTPILYHLPSGLPYSVRFLIALSAVIALAAGIAWATERRFAPWLQRKALQWLDARSRRAAAPAEPQVKEPRLTTKVD